jgi:hypothetical protein
MPEAAAASLQPKKRCLPQPDYEATTATTSFTPLSVGNPLRLLKANPMFIFSSPSDRFQGATET